MFTKFYYLCVFICVHHSLFALTLSLSSGLSLMYNVLYVSYQQYITCFSLAALLLEHCAVLCMFLYSFFSLTLSVL